MNIKSVFLACLCLFSVNSGKYTWANETLDSGRFMQPNKQDGVHTWWHWMSGNITKEGITKDLESMHANGITQATILNIGKSFTLRLNVPNIKFNSKEWFEMYRHALNEAKRLGMTIGVHNCDGWSTSGGPWITPEQSMKTTAWTRTYIDGGKKVKLKLDKPQANNGYYEDYACIAYPVQYQENSFVSAEPKFEVGKKDISDLLYDGNGKSGFLLNKGDVIDVECKKPVTVSRVSAFSYLPFDWTDISKVGQVFMLSYSEDGKNYKNISKISLTGMNKSLEVSFPEVKAKYFRFKCLSAHVKSKLTELELLGKDDKASFSPSFDYLFEKTVSVTGVNFNDYDVVKPKTKNYIKERDIVDLTSIMESDGTISWKAPSKGKWCIVRFGYTTTGITNAPATPEGEGLECDKLNPASVAYHFNSFSKKLCKESGEHWGKTLKFILIDSWECQFQNWTQSFPSEFKNRCGYDIKKWIPVLCGEIVNGPFFTSAFLNDYRETIADMLDESYYKVIAELCHENKLEMHAEVIYGSRGVYPPLDIINANRYADLPMTEFWAHPNKDKIPVYHPSVNPTIQFPYYNNVSIDKKVLGAEALTGFAHFTEYPALLKPFADLAFASGVNQFIMHSFVHQPFDSVPGLTLGHFAGHYNRNNPWWSHSQNWHKYMSRVQYMLQHGNQVADIPFCVGDELPQFFNKTRVYEIPAGFKGIPVNSDMLQNNLQVRNGKLVINNRGEYPFLVLSKQKCMSIASLTRIAELVNQGLVVLGDKPFRPVSMKDCKNMAEFKRLCSFLWKDGQKEVTYGKGKVICNTTIPALVSQLKLKPSLTTTDNNKNKFMFIHKTVGEYDLFYVFNQLNKEVKDEMIFKVSGKTPQVWLPYTGEVLTPMVYKQQDGFTVMPVSFGPYESKFFVFKKCESEQNIVNVKFNGNNIFPKKGKSDYNLELYKEKTSFGNAVNGKYEFTLADGKVVEKVVDKSSLLKLKFAPVTLDFSPCYKEKINQVKYASVSDMKSLTEYNDNSVKYFAGAVRYTFNFDVEETVDDKNYDLYLSMGDFAGVADIYLNGKYLFNAWMSGTEIKLPALQKNNKIEIVVTTTCRNRLIGDLRLYNKVKTVYTTAPVDKVLSKNMPLTKSGMWTPISIVKRNKSFFIK